jgi:hypothetical protein
MVAIQVVESQVLEFEVVQNATSEGVQNAVGEANLLNRELKEEKEVALALAAL